MIALLSPGDAAVITAVIALVASGLAAKNSKAIKQINRSVNHQADDAPTLIQRVIRLEQNQAIHTTWTAEVLVALADQVGVPIPDRPPNVLECPTTDRKAS